MSTDDRGGMTQEESIEFVLLALDNGNLTDAINFIMHDGDVRADSVTLAVGVLRQMLLACHDLDDVAHSRIDAATSRLIRLIHSWETT
jgi:hypothetical protein